MIKIDRNLFRFMSIGVMFAFLTYFWTELRGDDQLAVIGSFHLHMEDVAALFCFLGLLQEKKDYSRLNIQRICIAVILILALFSLMVGSISDVFNAFYNFRTRLVVLFFLSYVLLSGKYVRPINTYLTPIIAITFLFLGIFILRTIFGATLFLNPGTFAYLNIASLAYRPLNADSVLFLSFSFFLFVQLSLYNINRRQRILFGLLAISVILVILFTRQRTVTIACFSALAAFLIWEPKLLRQNLVAQLIFIFGISVAAFGFLGRLFDVVPESVVRAFGQTGTLEARIGIWKSAIYGVFDNWDLPMRLFGRPSSDALDIVTNLGLWKYSVHSSYVATLLNFGLIGSFFWALVCLVTFFQLGLGRHSLLSGELGLKRNVAFAWLIILLIYGFSYEWRDASGFFLAMCVACAQRISTGDKNAPAIALSFGRPQRND
tara:strand:- start:3753 stop:5051 length:1299 start_codon:yes stop_codon:yes gene_type:complete